MVYTWHSPNKACDINKKTERKKAITKDTQTSHTLPVKVMGSIVCTYEKYWPYNNESSVIVATDIRMAFYAKCILQRRYVYNLLLALF